jgi:hypothetical protein
MAENQWHRHYTAELERAERARSVGNEGMARVCARRAAGWVLAEYFQRRGIRFQDPNVVAKVEYLQKLDDIPPEIKDVAGHFILRIHPDHTLPLDVDLIAEARWFKKQLLGIE